VPVPAAGFAPAEEPADLLPRVLPALAPVAAAPPPATDPPAAEVPAAPARPDQAFACRYLRIQNDTGEKLKIFIQYRTRTDKDEWSWFPSAPAEGTDDVISYDFDPGMVADLTDNDWRLNASQVRVWAVSDSGQKWLDFKDADLVLVPEKNDKGEPLYMAPEMQTYLFSFAG
jgi:hypothetical protein